MNMDITQKSYLSLEFDKIKEELAKYAKFKQIYPTVKDLYDTLKA